VLDLYIYHILVLKPEHKVNYSPPSSDEVMPSWRGQKQFYFHLYKLVSIGLYDAVRINRWGKFTLYRIDNSFV